MTRTCVCRCGCDREIARRERQQSIARCVPCRKAPGPFCRRPKGTNGPRTVSAAPSRRVFEPFVDLPWHMENAKRIEAKLDRLAAQRKANRWKERAS